MSTARARKIRNRVQAAVAATVITVVGMIAYHNNPANSVQEPIVMQHTIDLSDVLGKNWSIPQGAQTDWHYDEGGVPVSNGRHCMTACDDN